jgi:short-subunit dehydrogenase
MERMEQMGPMKVLLTGATGGIGAALAIRLYGEGAELLLQGRNQDKLNALAQQLGLTGVRVEIITADLNRAADRQRLVEMAQSFGVDTLINNAGVNQFGFFASADIDRIIQTNVTSTLLLTQAMLPVLLASDRPKLVSVGSAFGSIGYPGYATYCAAKHAIKGFSEALKREYADTALQVTYVSPRATNTTMNTSSANELNQVLGVGSDSAELVADTIVKAILSKRSRVQLGFVEKIQAKLNALFPGLVDQATRKQLNTIKQYLSQEAQHEISHHAGHAHNTDTTGTGDHRPGVTTGMGSR